MVIDQIINFLQYDVGQLFNNNCCLCCLKFNVSSEKRKTKCKYEPRPKISNGDEEDCDDDEANEENEENDDDKSNNCEPVEDECGEAEQSKTKCPTVSKAKLQVKCKSNSTCQSVCQRILQMISSRCSAATTAELESIETRAAKLWTTLNGDCNPKSMNWWDLKSWQKLPFYWAALSNEILCEDPAENFKRFYFSTVKMSKRTAKKQNECALILWHSLNSKQRLPFIMEAFISKVSSGKVNMRDEHEIQRVIGELMRY